MKGEGLSREGLGISDGRAKLELLRAVAELAIARLAVARLSARDLLAMRQESQEPVTCAENAEIVKRVASAIPRAAKRVPWRADCLVQALAGRRWLLSMGVRTSLTCGVRKKDGVFAAHAWLRAGDVCVTGGDGTGYEAVIGPMTARTEKPGK